MAKCSKVPELKLGRNCLLDDYRPIEGDHEIVLPISSTPLSLPLILSHSTFVSVYIFPDRTACYPPWKWNICNLYNFWSQKYILASFKYMSNIFQIYTRYILENIYIKYVWNYNLNTQLLAKIYFIHFDIYLTYIFFPFFSMWDARSCQRDYGVFINFSASTLSIICVLLARLCPVYIQPFTR